jgi:hypothetical protein
MPMSAMNLIAAFALTYAVAIDPINLGTAGDFVILSKTGISTVPSSSITGDIGVSPIAATAMTGFTLIADASNTFATSTQVTGQAFAADYAAPTPTKMTTAIGDMETAYTDAAARITSSGATLNFGAGLIAGMTLKAGVYTWGTDIAFGSDIYVNGTETDIFIFQSTGNLIMGAGAKVILVANGSGGGTPKASNIVWQLAGFAKVGVSAHLEGIVLVKTKAVFETGSSLNGRVLAQTAVTLDMSTITAPPPPGVCKKSGTCDANVANACCAPKSCVFVPSKGVSKCRRA